MPAPLRPRLDLVIRLKRHGYRAVELDRRARHGGPTYATRMLGRRAVVLGDSHAARCFYDETAVARAGATPRPLKDLLFGPGAVHGLDGQEHASRKALMNQLVTPDDDLVAEVRHRLDDADRAWSGRTVDLFDELTRIYGEAALRWAGCDPTPAEGESVSRELVLIVDGFGSTGPAYARAWLARRRTHQWFRSRVSGVQRGDHRATAGSALEVLAHRGDLSRSEAAVELGNLVRPTVAVAWLGAFAALRLAQHPGWRPALATSDVGADHVAFAHEVRRTSPFVPVLAGRALRPFTVDGVPVRRGDRLVLDVWGIDTDPQQWPGADFDPDRFRDRCPAEFDMVPQGGGDTTGHRCPGEQRTVAVLAETIRALAAASWSPAPMGLDLTRIPTRPSGGPSLHWAGSR